MNDVLSITYCQIPNFSNYLIDVSGNVWSKKSNIILKYDLSHKQGYVQLRLTNDSGQRKHVFVHRLVGLTFIPNPNNLPEINHKDGDKSNNHMSNLEWCDSKHNKKHALETGLRVMPKGEKHYRTKVRS